MPSSATLPHLTEPRAAYVHVPFCRHRCGYCDFTLVAGRDDLFDAYLDALRKELASLRQPREVDTLYLGGGTPTHPAAPQLRELLQLACDWFEIRGEFTVEANPVDVTPEKIDLLADAGVNRISLGSQSFDLTVLQTLERDHTPEQIAAAVEVVRAAIDNVSLDLIFGVPGQTRTSWQDTLQRAIDLAPSHVSTYGLTYEKGTAFWNRRRRGDLLTVDDVDERQMYETAIDRLAAAGLPQYEVSSFANPGRESQHNLAYWTGRPYFGFGPGAARYVDGIRETSVRSVAGWIKRMQRDGRAVEESETLSAVDRAREAAVLRLRMRLGIDLHEFQRDTGFDLFDLAAEPIDRHCANGWIECDRETVRLTRAGLMFADSIAVDFL